jgi:PAS domain S-box-containing protein
MLSSQNPVCQICLSSFASSVFKQVILLLCLIPATVAASNEIETVTLQLKWQHQFQFAGYYAALEKGFYREAGLDVKIQSFGSDLKSPIDQVLSGAAQYGVMDSSLVKYRLHGKPVVVLAVIFQKSPLAWLVHQDSGIRGPHDLVGKRAMYHTASQNELLAMLQVEGIPVSKINLIPSSFNVQDFIDGQTDAYDAYTTNEPYLLREQGIPYRLITPRNYGIDFYTDVLFTSAAEIDEHPERVKAFRLASLKGWEYAMDHPEEIVDLIINKYDSSKSRPQLEFEAEAMRKFIMPDLITIGHINSGRWRVIAERLVSLGLAEANYNLLEGFIYDPSPKPQDLTQFRVIIVLVTLLALLFLSLAIWIGRLNIRLKKSELRIQERNLKLETLNDKLNQSQEVSHIGSYVWDLGPDRTTWTDELYRITGYPPASFEPSYEKYINRIHPDDRDEFIALKQKVLHKMGGYSAEYRIIRPDGEVRYIHEQDEVKVDAKAEVIGLFGIIQDITERKLAEKEKQDLQRELQRAQKMDALGKLTGGIAHDYNNMLGVITGYAELLKGALDKQPRLAKYAHQIQYAGERSAKLTKKLLAFSQTKTPEANSLNLNMLLLKQEHMLEKTLTARIKLVLNLEKNLWLIWLDDSDLEDAILNMSINAMHAIEGSGQLTIQTSNQKINQMAAQSLGIRPDDYVLLSITDSGCGIDKETIEKIFDPFYSTKGEQGSGLGLSQVYGFVQRSGGVIKVDSEPGQGTQFTLYFPRYHESGDAQQSAEDYPATAFIGDETILVVDDEPALLDLSGEILGLSGFNVICAESAKQALDILQHKSVDLLISDIIMPEMDGYQLAAIVKEKYPAIKIQLASGFSDERNMDKIDESLQQNMLLKPFNSQALLQRVRELLNE